MTNDTCVGQELFGREESAWWLSGKTPDSIEGTGFRSVDLLKLSKLSSPHVALSFESCTFSYNIHCSFTKVTILLS